MPVLCPSCGNELPRRAATCPDCGKDPNFLRELTDPVGRGEQAAGFLRGALRSKSRSWVVRAGRAVLIVGFLVPLLVFLYSLVDRP